MAASGRWRACRGLGESGNVQGPGDRGVAKDAPVGEPRAGTMLFMMHGLGALEAKGTTSGKQKPALMTHTVWAVNNLKALSSAS